MKDTSTYIIQIYRGLNSFLAASNKRGYTNGNLSHETSTFSITYSFGFTPPPDRQTDRQADTKFRSFHSIFSQTNPRQARKRGCAREWALGTGQVAAHGTQIWRSKYVTRPCVNKMFQSAATSDRSIWKNSNVTGKNTDDQRMSDVTWHHLPASVWHCVTAHNIPGSPKNLWLSVTALHIWYIRSV